MQGDQHLQSLDDSIFTSSNALYTRIPFSVALRRLIRPPLPFGFSNSSLMSPSLVNKVRILPTTLDEAIPSGLYSFLSRSLIFGLSSTMRNRISIANGVVRSFESLVRDMTKKVRGHHRYTSFSHTNNSYIITGKNALIIWCSTLMNALDLTIENVLPKASGPLMQTCMVQSWSSPSDLYGFSESTRGNESKTNAQGLVIDSHGNAGHRLVPLCVANGVTSSPRATHHILSKYDLIIEDSEPTSVRAVVSHLHLEV